VLNSTIPQSVATNQAEATIPVYSVLGPRDQYPALPGVYAIWCNGGNGDPVDWDEPAYIGQTTNFRKRVLQHRSSPHRMFTDAAMLTFMHIPDANVRIAMEKWLIQKHLPSYNRTWKRTPENDARKDAQWRAHRARRIHVVGEV
jgi:predicted GIY-YIG superfamily endonuclease